MMPVPVIANPIPLKPKGGFSVADIVGSRTETIFPKFQNSNLSMNAPKSEAYFGSYPLVPRTELTSSFERYTPPMYSSLAPQDIANLEYLELLRSRVPLSPPTVLGADIYPWLFNRPTRFFPSRIQGPESFFFHPFRKPKRVRTAFSPSQLLQLEHAFEKNHYVVGNERRQLADTLNLTETQVKVWFQNRRTKHKRQKPDDDPICKEKNKDFCDTQESSLSSDEETVALLENNSPINKDSVWNSRAKDLVEVSSVSAYSSNFSS